MGGGGVGGVNPLENLGQLFGMSGGGSGPAAGQPAPAAPPVPTIQNPGMAKPLTLFGRAPAPVQPSMRPAAVGAAAGGIPGLFAKMGLR